MLYYRVEGNDDAVIWTGDMAIYLILAIEASYPGIKYDYLCHYTDPQFKNTVIESNKWFIIGIDDENSAFDVKAIKNIVESSHDLYIPQLDATLNQIGVHLILALEISNHLVDLRIQDYYAENNFGEIYESIGNKWMTTEQIIDFVSSELNKIKHDSTELLIIDPYLLWGNHDNDYYDVLKGILKEVGVKTVKIVVDPEKIDLQTMRELKTTIGLKSKIFTSESIHDRYWIFESDRIGITIGASLNGVGKRKGTHALPLSSCDIEKIISDVNSNITEYK